MPPIWLLALAVSGANVGMSILLPAVTDIRVSLGTTAGEAQLVLGIFLLMLGLGQPLAGSISDHAGRRPVLVLGALLFTLSGAAALFSPNVQTLIALRALQGIGAACCMAMGRVIINDCYEKNEAGRQLSTIIMVQTVVPLLGFAFGGLLAQVAGWRGTVSIMAASGVLVLVSTWLFLAETRAPDQRKTSLWGMIAVYGRLARTFGVITNSMTGALVTAAFFTMGGFMPYEFQRMGVSTFGFGLYFAATPVGYIIGNSMNRHIGPLIGLERAALFGTAVSAVVVALLLCAAATNLTTPALIALFLFFYGAGNGFVVANSIVCAVRAAGWHSGAATGLAGALQMIGAAGFGSLAISLGGDTDFVLALFVTCALVVAGLGFAWLAQMRAPRHAPGL